MLEKYYEHDGWDDEIKWKRLIAVQAALEVAKESARSGSQAARSDKVENDLVYTAKEIGTLADAIQTALAKE